MKAKVKMAIPGYTGKLDDIVIYFNSKLNCTVVRKRVTPEQSISNTDFRTTVKMIKRLAVSEDFRQDCRDYVTRYNQKNRRHNRAYAAWTNLFIKIMLRFKSRFPDIDLATLTKAEIYENDYSCQSVYRAVRDGLVDKVRDFQSLSHAI